MLPIIKRNCDKIVDKFANLSDDEPCEVQKAFHDLFMDTFSEIAFGWNSNSFGTNSKFGENYDKIFMLFIKRFSNPLWKFQRWLNIGYERELADRLRRHKEIIRKVVLSAIEEKKGNSNSQAKNLIHRLLDISI